MFRRSDRELLEGLETKLDTLILLLVHETEAIQMNLDEIKVKVDANRAAIDAAVVKIDQLVANSADPVKLQAIADALDASTQVLNDKVGSV